MVKLIEHIFYYFLSTYLEKNLYFVGDSSFAFHIICSGKHFVFLEGVLIIRNEWKILNENSVYVVLVSSTFC